ncbi:MAG TPA: TetR/AcrR family transcriptional regulator [Acidimicrobiales bacterium]
MPHRNQIDRTQVLAAALRIADRTGPDSITMRGVAAEVGVAPMSLYHHVIDRDELLVGMVDLLLEQVPDTVGRDTPWRRRLRFPFLVLRDLAYGHPRTFPLVLTQRRSPQVQRLRRIGIDAMVDAGVPVAHVLRTDAVVWTLVLGFVTRESIGQFRDQAPGEADRDASAVLAAVEHHVPWVAEDPERAHPDDPELTWSPSEDDG